jgi:hypothetical protein
MRDPDMVVRINPFQDARPIMKLSELEDFEEDTGMDASFLVYDGYVALIPDIPKEVRDKLVKYPSVKI